MLENCNVKQILQTRLMEAVQIGVFENAVRGVTMDIKVAFEDNAILRERAGLVSAQQVHGAEVLD